MEMMSILVSNGKTVKPELHIHRTRKSFEWHDICI